MRTYQPVIFADGTKIGYCFGDEETKMPDRVDIFEIAKMHPYKESGNPDSYTDFNQGWSMAIDKVIEEMAHLGQPPHWTPIGQGLPTEKDGDQYGHVEVIRVKTASIRDMHYLDVNELRATHWRKTNRPV